MGSASFSQPEAFEDFTVVWVDDAFDMDQLARLGSEFDD
jgi:hypothetical protein